MVTILRMVTIQLQPFFFFIVCEFGSQKFLPDRVLALKYHYRSCLSIETQVRIWRKKVRVHLESFFKLPWNNFETFLKHPWKFLTSPLNLPWNTLKLPCLFELNHNITRLFSKYLLPGEGGGDGILQLPSHLMIPLLTQALKRWRYKDRQVWNKIAI